jgi:putative ABC transport system permease protein
VAGITFAVVLMLVQLGFEEAALMTSAGLHVNALQCDLILATPNYQYLSQPGSFPERRRYQAAGDSRVVSIAPLYLTGLPWTNPVTRRHRMILVIGAPPRQGVFALPEIDTQMMKLRDPEAALYDEKVRSEYGPVARSVRHGGRSDGDCEPARCDHRAVQQRHDVRCGWDRHHQRPGIPPNDLVRRNQPRL